MVVDDKWWWVVNGSGSKHDTIVVDDTGTSRICGMVLSGRRWR